VGPEPPLPLSPDALLSEAGRPDRLVDPPRGLGARALFLDLDGTLAASLDVARHAYETFLRRAGAEPTSEEFDQLNGPPLAEVVRRIKDTHRLAGDEPDLLVAYRALLEDLYLDVLPSDGARALLERAREAKWRTGVVTSNSRALTTAWLRRVDLEDLVDIVVSGDDVTTGKPDPEPYLLALEACRCAASDTVAVEDSEQGATAARAAGIRTLLLGRVGPRDGAEVAEGVLTLADVQAVLWP
jgi:HAD superfamily hydrolase (TIGR01509 family)